MQDWKVFTFFTPDRSIYITSRYVWRCNISITTVYCFQCYVCFSPVCLHPWTHTCCTVWESSSAVWWMLLPGLDASSGLDELHPLSPWRPPHTLHQRWPEVHPCNTCTHTQHNLCLHVSKDVCVSQLVCVLGETEYWLRQIFMHISGVCHLQGSATWGPTSATSFLVVLWFRNDCPRTIAPFA